MTRKNAHFSHRSKLNDTMHFTSEKTVSSDWQWLIALSTFCVRLFFLMVSASLCSDHQQALELRVHQSACSILLWHHCSQCQPLTCNIFHKTCKAAAHPVLQSLSLSLVATGSNVLNGCLFHHKFLRQPIWTTYYVVRHTMSAVKLNWINTTSSDTRCICCHSCPARTSRWELTS